MLHFYDTHFSGSAFCLLHNIWQAAPRQGGQEAGTRMRQAARSVGVSAAKGFIFYFFFLIFLLGEGDVALSERYKGTLCASDLLLLLSVMAS